MDIEGLCCVASQHIVAAAATTPTESSDPSSSTPSIHTRPEFVISQDFGWQVGQILHIGFLDGNEWQKGQVRHHAVEWCRYANLDFVFDAPVNSSCEILITFSEPGSWSQLGTFSLLKTKVGKASMNFGWMLPGVPQADLRATILHEFGHALGLVHEHQCWRSSVFFNVPEVYRKFRGPPNNWSDKQIRVNILTEFRGPGLITKAQADDDSIMLYTFPPDILLDYDKMEKNLEISLLDKGAMFARYPGRDLGDLRDKIEMCSDGTVGKVWIGPEFKHGIEHYIDFDKLRE